MRLKQLETINNRSEFVTSEEWNSLDYYLLEENGISFKEFSIILELFETHFQVSPEYHKTVENVFQKYLDIHVDIQDYETYVYHYDNKSFIEFTPTGLSRISSNMENMENYSYWESLESHIRTLILKTLSQYEEDIIIFLLQLLYVELFEEKEKLRYYEYALKAWIPEGFLYIY